MKTKTSLIQKSIQASLTILCFILVYLLWIETKPLEVSIAPTIEQTMSVEDESKTFPGIENTIPDINEFDEMINRPLFSETRQPYVEEIEVEKQEEIKKPNTRKTREEYSLNAVIITPAKKIAIIQTSKSKELQRIGLGESIDDWLIDSINTREIKMTRGNETKSLVLEVKNSSPNKKTSASSLKTKTNNDSEENIEPLVSTETDSIKDNNQQKTSIDTEAVHNKDVKPLDNQKDNNEN
jgi:hypothetical protein